MEDRGFFGEELSFDVVAREMQLCGVGSWDIMTLIALATETVIDNPIYGIAA